jgi:hypothetical protein
MTFAAVLGIAAAVVAPMVATSDRGYSISVLVRINDFDLTATAGEVRITWAPHWAAVDPTGQSTANAAGASRSEISGDVIGDVRSDLMMVDSPGRLWMYYAKPAGQLYDNGEILEIGWQGPRIIG